MISHCTRHKQLKGAIEGFLYLQATCNIRIAEDGFCILYPYALNKNQKEFP